MDKMIKTICLVALVLLVITLPAAALPSVIGSGVSKINHMGSRGSIDQPTDNLLETKDTWTKSEASGDFMAVWIKIQPGSDIKWDKAGCTNAASGCTGSVQYYAQWRIFTPDGKDWLKDYRSASEGALYDTNQGKIYLSQPKFFRGADSSSKAGDEYGGPIYAGGDFTSSSINRDHLIYLTQWQGKWKVEIYIYDSQTKQSTLVNTQYFTLVDDTQTTTPTTKTTTVPYGYITTTTQTTAVSGSWPAVVDYGIVSYDPVNKKVLEKKSVWTAADKGKSIAIWVQYPPKTDFRYRYVCELLNPDGSVFTSKEYCGSWYFDNGMPAWPWTQTVNYMFTDPHQEGTYTVNLWQSDFDTKAERKIDTLHFTLGSGGTTPVTVITSITPSQAGLVHIEGEAYTSADVQKTGAEWDSTEEKCPTWRENDWSGTGDYYLSHGGDTLSYSFNVPDSAKYAMWVRDWSDTNHAKGDRQITVNIDGATIGTFDTAYSFNKGTTGYGWDKLANIDLSAGPHAMKITKKDTTSSAAIIDNFFFTPDLNEVPKGAIGHSEALCSGTAKPGTTTPQAGITPYIPPVVVSACSGTGTSVYAEDRTMQQGSTVKIPIMVCNANDLANMDLVVSYDTSVLKFRSAEKGGLNANSLFESNEASPGTVMISFASSTGNSGSASIAMLTFDVIGSNGSTSPIKITVKTASTSSGSTIPVTVSQGTFTTGTPNKVTFDGGPVTSRDALAALQMAVGKIPTDMKYDVTKDGSVNSADARAILKIAVSSQ